MITLAPNGVGSDHGSLWVHRLRLITVIAAILVYLTLALLLAWTRIPIDDDAFYASAAYNLYAHGFTGTTIYEPAAYPFPGADRRTYTYPPLYIVVQAGWYKLVGFGIHQMRLLSTLSGLAVLAAWYVIVRRLIGSKELALLVVGLLAIDYTVLLTASLGRMSMMSAALSYGALAFYLSWRSKSLTRALLLSNTCAMLAGLAHPLAGVLTLANLVFLVILYDRKRVSWIHGWSIMLPYVIGAVGWGLYIAQDPATFLAQFTASATQGRRLGGFKGPVSTLVSEVYDRYLGYYGYSTTRKDFRVLLLLSYLAGPIFALAIPSIRRSREYRVLGAMTALSFITMALIEGTRQRVYMIHTIPFLIVWVAVSIYWLWSKGKVARQFAVVASLVFVMLHVAAIAYRVRLNPYFSEYMPVVEQVRPVAQNGSLIFGPAPLRFELGFDTNVIFDPDLGAISGKVPELIVLDDQSRITMESQWEAQPERRAKARAVLAGYHQVFRNGQYEIYARNPQP